MASSCSSELAPQSPPSLLDFSFLGNETFESIDKAIKILQLDTEHLVSFEDQAFISKVTQANFSLQREKIATIFEKFTLTKFLATKIGNHEAYEVVNLAIPLLKGIACEEKKHELLLAIYLVHSSEREQVSMLTKALFDQLPPEFHSPEIMVLPTFLWVKFKTTTMKVNRYLKVLPISKSTGHSFNFLNFRV